MTLAYRGAMSCATCCTPLEIGEWAWHTHRGPVHYQCREGSGFLPVTDTVYFLLKTTEHSNHDCPVFSGVGPVVGVCDEHNEVHNTLRALGAVVIERRCGAGAEIAVK